MSWGGRCSLCSQTATHKNIKTVKLWAVFGRCAHEGSNLPPTWERGSLGLERKKV